VLYSNITELFLLAFSGHPWRFQKWDAWMCLRISQV
jgi:hypothetical protein